MHSTIFELEWVGYVCPSCTGVGVPGPQCVRKHVMYMYRLQCARECVYLYDVIHVKDHFLDLPW